MTSEDIMRTMSRVHRLTGLDNSFGKYVQNLCVKVNAIESEKFNDIIKSIDSRKELTGVEINWGVPIPERVVPNSADSIGRITPRTESDVKNLYESLDNLLNIDNWETSGLSESLALQIHSETMKHTTGGGKYKDKPNDILLWDGQDTTKRIEIKNSPVELAKPQLISLVQWAAVLLRLEVAHPIYIISVFSFEFLRIHPFNDGNGRTIRQLIILILIINGYEFIKYTSLEKFFEQERRLQFACLTGDNEETNLRNWTRFILLSLDKLSYEYESTHQKV